MPIDHDLLVHVETSLARAQDGATVRRWAHPDAIFVVPGFVLGLDDYAGALDVSEEWDRIEVEHDRTVRVGDDAVAVVSRFTGLRGDRVYRADTVSTYVDTVEGPRLVTHQHTPEWTPDDEPR
ncbi:hypothetical protein F8O01_04240 [Pseudoclavibacter chungangensis]|uniref:Nuclear transport factor 2 family protein n=1 Tax=Pseudoclavibacter chungangensis TaxID=587635 RepID=A0A7J5C281_9MICO|nr:hypothetical protein [Pseudoclavibacter chungangensis]KAB1660141.1 hypothetical protein F8O01_04240 [Pseudoclavibacter chungangensis]NYJ66751.1 hypothetical protein [Pseudoclavibacter chungangensis]